MSRRLMMRYLLLCLAALLAPVCTAQSDWQGVERVVAVADLHGDYDNYITVLRQAGVIDRRGRWDAGKAHLVQLGDVPDRGPDSDKIIRHLMKLEEQAKKAGGKVHPLIGNHEVMNITGDLRYVHPGEYEALTTRNSKRLQENYFERVAAYLKENKGEDFVDEAFREQWFKDHPRGYVEHRQHWHPEGEFGAWVASHNTVIRINRSLFVHGGLGPAYLERSMDDINEVVRGELHSLDAADRSVIQDEQGPLWYRGLSMGEETDEISAHVDALMERFDVDRIVMGHTPGFGTVVPRYHGRVLAADSGIAEYYGGNLASVVIEDGQAYTLQRGERVAIPDGDAGLLEYYRAIDNISPDINNLKVLIQRLEAAEDAASETEGEARS